MRGQKALAAHPFPGNLVPLAVKAHEKVQDWHDVCISAAADVLE